MILVNRFLLRKKFSGMAIWPFILVRHPALRENIVFINHERIHLRQQVELLVVFFYLWYSVEFLIRWAMLKNRFLAYRAISFEREAYAEENNISYLKQRPFWRFLHYL